MIWRMSFFLQKLENIIPYLVLSQGGQKQIQNLRGTYIVNTIKVRGGIMNNKQFFDYLIDKIKKNKDIISVIIS